METSSTSGQQAGTTAAAQAGEQLKTTLSSADALATQAIESLAQVHQARLAKATRVAAALKAQYGADDPRVQAAEASVTATNTTIARVSMVGQQLAAPSVQVAKAGWVLQGRVLDAQLQPAAKFTVFLVDTNKNFLQQYGFAYTDDTGYFLLNYAGESGQAATASQFFIEVADTGANPVYLSSTAFQPVTGTASFQNIVLPAGEQPIGDPPAAIRAVALPGKATKTQPQTTTRKSAKSGSASHRKGHERAK